MKRSISLLLLFVILLAACSSSNDIEETTADITVSETTAETTEYNPYAEFEALDFDGATLTIDISVNESEWNTSAKYVMGGEAETGETVSDMVYRRNRDIAEMLNVNVEWIESDLHINGIVEYIEKAVLSGSSETDMYINDQRPMVETAIKGYLFNVLDDSYESYFDFDHEGWYTEYMDSLTMNKNKHFFLAGDYFIDILRGSHVMYFNRNMMRDNFGDADAIYKLVLDKEWTYEKKFYYVDNIYTDLNGNSEVDADDLFGFWPCSSDLFIYSTDVASVKYDDAGTPYLEPDVERGARLTDTVLKFYASKSNLYKLKSTFSSQDICDRFVEDKLLFTYWLKIAAFENSVMREYDGIGIAPYPLFDEAQEDYITAPHTIVESGGIPVSIDSASASALSAYLQAMTVQSCEELMPVYFETVLKVKYSQDDYSAQMLDIISSTIRSPFVVVYNVLIDRYFSLPLSNSVSMMTNTYASTVASMQDAAEIKLESIIEAFS